MELISLTIEQMAHGLRAKEFSAVDLVRAYLARIEALNPSLFAYLNVDAEGAIIQAKSADSKLGAGVRDDSMLLGVPVAIKDNMVISDQVATAGSRILETYKSPYTATVVKKLQDAGAVVLGKTNLDEFAMGSSTENSAYGPSKNPWDASLVPGGSSGGSAVAVAADLAAFSLGSDTGGSIRQPASFCGVVGLKPTYGRVSRYGLMAMSSSLDQIGPMTKSVKDAARVLNCLAGFDPNDATTLPRSPEDFTTNIETGIKDMKIGVPREYFVDGMQTEVSDCINRAIEQLAGLGAKIVDVSLPSVRYALAAYYIIVPVEVASNLARYDGIRYGLFASDAQDLLSGYRKTREQGFGAEVKRRIMLGTFTSSAGYYDAYYKKALLVQQIIRNDFERAFEEVDLLVSAVSPTVAFPLGERVNDPLEMYLADILTVPANIAGLPGISVPGGFAGNAPVGVQFMSSWWNEAKLLRAAYAFEQANEYYKAKPKQ